MYSTASGSCFIELRSWGREDSSLVGYARINDVIVANYTKQNNDDFRGFNTQLIRTKDCAAFDSRHFDTSASGAQSSALANYIDTLANGSILYGVTCDDANTALGNDTRAVLMAIGVDVTELVYRGKVTFIAVIGRPQWTVFSVARNGGDNLVMNAIVTKTVEDFMSKYRIF